MRYPLNAEKAPEYGFNDIPDHRSDEDLVDEMCLSVGDIYGTKSAGSDQYDPRKVVGVNNGNVTVTDPREDDDETWVVNTKTLYVEWRSDEVVILEQSFRLASPETLDTAPEGGSQP